VVWLGPVAAPLHEEAVGKPGEDAMDPDRVFMAQPAGIVMARDIEPGVESVFNSPSGPVGDQPLASIEPLEWGAGQ